MDRQRPSYAAMEIATDIRDMYDEILRLEAEVEHLSWFKDAYFTLVRNQEQHNKAMTATLLTGLLAKSETENELNTAASPDQG